MYFHGAGSPEHKPLIVDLHLLQGLSRIEAGSDICIGHNYGLTTYTKASEAIRAISLAARKSGDARLAPFTPDADER